MKRILLAMLFSGLAYPQTPTPAAVPDDLTRLRTQLEGSQRVLKDWPNLARYRDDNGSLPPPVSGVVRVVFMGDSITDNWGRKYSKFLVVS